MAAMTGVGIIVRFTCKDPKTAQVLVQAGRAHFDRQLTNEPGALRTSILTSTSSPSTVLFEEQFASAEAYEAHKVTSHLKSFMETSTPLHEGVALEYFSGVSHFAKPTFASSGVGILVTLPCKDEESRAKLVELGATHFGRQLPGEEGAVRATVYSGSDTNPTRVCFVEHWREMLDLTADHPRGHQNTPHLNDFKAAVPALLAGDLEVETFDCIEHFTK